MPGAGREFDQLAEGYDRHRPDYPDELMRTLRAHVEAGEHPAPATVVDAGAGTGIATRLLRAHLGRGYRIIGIEPGEGMRRQAIDSTTADLGITYIEATAEEMPFEDGSLAAVVVAQAVQWFDRPRFYAEARRVLRRGGTLAILQNNRDWRTSPFLDAYETFMETHNPAYTRHYRAFDIQTELAAVPGLNAASPLCVAWERPMTVDGFLGMALSSSRLQQVVRLLGEEETRFAVRALASQHVDHSGLLRVRYQSDLYLAERASP